MQVAADFLRLLHDRNQVVRQILRVGSHEADALQPLYLLHLLQKLRKGDGLVQILSIGIHVLAQQHDLHHAVRHQSLYLPDDFPGLPAALPAPHVGHDAVAAEVVAAEHDVDAGLEGIFTFYRQVFYDFVRIFPNVNQHALCLEGGIEEFSKFIDIVGAENQVDKWVAFL